MRPFLTCLAILMTSAAPLRAEDWPRWGGPRGDETWHGPEIPERWPEGGLPETWRATIGGGYSGVAVANGRVYVQDHVAAPTGKNGDEPSGDTPADKPVARGETEGVLCFDLATGRPLWSHRYPVAYEKLDYGSGPRAMPTVHDGRVYTLGAVGHVHCLDAVTGRVLWSHDAVAAWGAKLPLWGLAASPLIVGELVVFHPGVPEDGCLVACRQSDGEVAWRSGGDPAGYATPVLIDAPSGRQLVAWTPEHIVGMSPETGRIHWKVPYKVTYGVSIATPLYHDGIVFVSGYWEGSKAIRLGAKAEVAELLWEDNRHLRGLMAQPIRRGGHVYTLDKQYGVTCFELATGRKLWDDKNTLTPRGRNPQVTLTWLGDSDRMIGLNADGELVQARLSPDGFRELARAKVIEPAPPSGVIWAHPAYAEDKVVMRSDRELVCRKIGK